MKIEINTEIQNGKFKVNRNWILRTLKQLDGCKVKLTIEKIRSKRSNPQNAYYWGVVIPLIKQGLYDSTHEVFNENIIHYDLLSTRFAPVKTITNENTGEFIEIKIRTSEMTKTEFSDYILKIQQFAMEFLNVEIPLPNENITLWD